MNYQLDLSFTHEDLAYLDKLGQHVAIAKAVDGKIANVVWVGFQPAPNNSLTWEENYGLYYVDRGDLPDGTILTQSDNLKARDNAPYQVDNLFRILDSSAPDDKQLCKVGSFYIKNNVPAFKKTSLVCGLYQALKIGSTEVTNSKGLPPIINASPVGSGQHGLFTPITTVYIWVEASNTTGSVISHVSGNITQVQLTGNVPQALRFNKDDSTFVIEKSKEGDNRISYEKNPRVFSASGGNEIVTRQCNNPNCKKDVSVSVTRGNPETCYVIGCCSCATRDSGGTVYSAQWPKASAGSFATIDTERS